MEANGWSVMGGGYGFNPSGYRAGIPAASYTGFVGGPAVGAVQRTLRGSGTVTVDFGSAFTHGSVRVLLNGVVKATAPANTASKKITLAYKDGDVLKLDEVGTSIVRMNSVCVSLGAAVLPSWYFLPTVRACVSTLRSACRETHAWFCLQCHC